MEKNKKDKKKGKANLTKSQKNIRLSDGESSNVNAVFFDLEGDIVYRLVRYLWGYSKIEKIPQEEIDMYSPIVKIKSILYLQKIANTASEFNAEIREELFNLNPLKINEPETESILKKVHHFWAERKFEKENIVRRSLGDIWNFDYGSQFQLKFLQLFSECDLAPEFRLKIKQMMMNRQPYIIDLPPIDFNFFNLPNELISNIITYLSTPMDIINISKCNKILYEVCNGPSIWKALCAIYRVPINCNDVKSQFAAYYLQPPEQVLYAQENDGWKYNFYVIPSEELKQFNYALIKDKYMLGNVTPLVLTVNIENFDKRLESYKYSPNYMHECVGFLKELMVQAATHEPTLGSIIVLLLDPHKKGYKKLSNTDCLIDFPNLVVPADAKSALEHFVILFKQLHFDLQALYPNELKPTLLVQYENLETGFFAENFLRILRHIKLRPIL